MFICMHWPVRTSTAAAARAGRCNRPLLGTASKRRFRLFHRAPARTGATWAGLTSTAPTSRTRCWTRRSRSCARDARLTVPYCCAGWACPISAVICIVEALLCPLYSASAGTLHAPPRARTILPWQSDVRAPSSPHTGRAPARALPRLCTGTQRAGRVTRGCACAPSGIGFMTLAYSTMLRACVRI